MSETIKLAAAEVFFLILLIKWDVPTYWQLYRPKWAPEKCNFCFFFWLTFIYIVAKHKTEPTFDAALDMFTTVVFALVIFKFLISAINEKREN